MKKQLLFILITIFTINCYSQISFEKGYYIDNSNQKIDCLIKNIDWKNNPIDFKYKLSENSKIKNINIKFVKEFVIYNFSKHIRETVKIDRSSENINHLSYDTEPIFEEEQLFLKVLVEGRASLFLYSDGNLRRYFYNKENAKIEQLIFKSYRFSGDKIGRNNQFKHQLWNDLKCSTIVKSRTKNLEYKKKSLLNFFLEYNKCTNSEFVNFEEKQKKDMFNLTFRPRLNNSSLALQNSPSSINTNFGNETGFGFGVEAEFILSFNNNKWAILVEPTYQNFKSEKTTNVINVSGGKLIANVDYNSIEIPVGLRHYFFLNEYSKIFANISFVFDVSSKSSIVFNRADNSNFDTLAIDSQNNLAFGVGYKLYDKYSLEMRYQTGREVLINLGPWSSDYKTLSVIFGYSIF